MSLGTVPTTATTVHKNESIEQMSFLTIYNAHNGEMTKIPKPIRYHTMHDFKQFICQSFTNYLIEDNDTVFLLTSFGIRLNFNIINEINEVYVFDKRMFNENKSLVDQYFQSNIGDYPNLVVEFDQLHTHDSQLQPEGSNGNIRLMSTKLKRFDAWCNNYLHHIRKNSEAVHQYLKQINNIFRSLNIIFQFINNFISEVEKGFNSYYNYVKLINFKSLQKSWPAHYQTLKKLPTVKFKDQTSISLVNLVDYNLLQKNSEFIGEHLPLILNKFNDLVSNINGINNDKVAIDKIIETKRNESIEAFKHKNHDSVFNKAKELVAEINKKLEDENLDSHDIQAVFSACQNYQRELLEYGKSSKELLTTTKDFKYGLLTSSFSILNKISSLQMAVVDIKNEVKRLSQPSGTDDLLSYQTISKIKSAEDYLSLTVDLPLLFGFILIEKRRQFEWYDFFSKGVVQNVTEQLMTIMEHEKVFQKLWLKKFGTFLNFLTNNVPVKPQLPSLDITLINNQAQDMFKVLGEFEVERDDVLEYIKMVEQFESKNNGGSSKFSNLLNKNFKDLVKSTNNMKMVTRLVTSMANLTSPNEDLSNSKIKNMMQNDTEYNDNLVKGLKVRIRKLEDLLHQQQFKNLSNWPVTRGYNSTGSTPASTPPPGQQKYPSSQQVSPVTPQAPVMGKNVSAPLIRTSSVKKSSSTNGHKQEPEVTSPKSNPTSLLRKNSTSTPLDASTTIDKHLDNLRLRKENKELLEENNRLKQSNFAKDMEIEKLISQIQQLQSDQSHSQRKHEHELQNIKAEHQKHMDDIKAQHERELDIRGSGFEHQVNELKNRNEESLKDLMKQVKQNETMLQEYKVLNDIKEATLKDLNTRNEKNTQEISDLTKLKEDLVSNMTSKETEYKLQINNYEDELKKLTSRLEEKSEEYEHLIEVTQQQSHSALISNLNSVVESLMLDVKRSLYVNYDFFIEMVMILESVGLLLVKEVNKDTKIDEYKISRVKGLRSKKQEEGDISFASFDDKPTTKVIGDVDQSMSWIHQLQENHLILDDDHEVKSLSTSVDGSTHSNEHGLDHDNEDDKAEAVVQKSYDLISTYSKYFKLEDSEFNKFLKLISFKNDVSDRFFLAAIAKRFRDVEGFAKKLTKENKLKVQEMNKLIKASHNKISMNHFSIGDLALFLPTRIEHASKVKIKYQPWAAFNIGAPHYFLNTIDDPHNNHLSNKEWLVAKVIKIEEFKVTEENVEDEEKNPFKLSTGITWFLVDAKEE